MRTFMCGCGRKYLLCDYNRCPVCNFDLMNHTDEYARKHVERCKGKLNPYMYSDKGPGRPPKYVVEKELAQRVFVKRCTNCGAHCSGIDEGVCEHWEPKRLGRCPCCGMNPIFVEKCGTCAIICDKCNLKMEDTDRNALLTRWARIGMN